MRIWESIKIFYFAHDTQIIEHLYTPIIARGFSCNCNII